MKLTRDMFKTNKDVRELLKKYEIVSNPDALDNKQLSCLRKYLIDNDIETVEDLQDSMYFDVYDILDGEDLDYGNYDGVNEKTRFSNLKEHFRKRIKNSMKSFKDFLHEEDSKDGIKSVIIFTNNKNDPEVKTVVADIKKFNIKDIEYKNNNDTETFRINVISNSGKVVFDVDNIPFSKTIDKYEEYDEAPSWMDKADARYADLKKFLDAVCLKGKSVSHAQGYTKSRRNILDKDDYAVGDRHKELSGVDKKYGMKSKQIDKQRKF